MSAVLAIVLVAAARRLTALVRASLRSIGKVAEGVAEGEKGPRPAIEHPIERLIAHPGELAWLNEAVHRPSRSCAAVVSGTGPSRPDPSAVPVPPPRTGGPK